MSLAPFCSQLKSTRSVLNHRTCRAIEVTAAYSASDDEKANVSCFFELQVTTQEPRLSILPEVLLRVSKQPAQSLYVKPINLKSGTLVYQIPKIFVPAIDETLVEENRMMRHRYYSRNLKMDSGDYVGWTLRTVWAAMSG
uniref:Uncharacterized protein n=1 Tax=Tanacetum cinerariifolium TaxID=118510 RepID=A0A699K181_TANCI|nr:hypothetical protein [Tanacetum cinerariifolium]